MDGVTADPRALTTESIETAGAAGARGSRLRPDHEGDPGQQAASAGDAWPDAVEVAPGVLSFGGAVPATLGRGSLPAAQPSRTPRPDLSSGDSPPAASAASVDQSGQGRSGEGRSGEGRSGEGRGKRGPGRVRRPWRGHGLGPARMVLAAATAGLVAVAALAVARDAAARTGSGADVTNSGVGWRTEAGSPGVDDALPGQELGTLPTSDPSPAQPGASPSETSPAQPGGSDAGARVSEEWAAVVRVLDERRAAAFARADPTAVAGYALPGSPAFEADVALLEELAAGHQRAIGVSTRLVSVDPDESLAAPESTASAPTGGASTARARLAVVDERSAYELLAESGESRTVQASGPRQWLITLDQVPGDDADGMQWRIVRVDPGR